MVEPPRLEYKGFKYKYNLKGDICRLLLARTNSKSKKKDMSHLTFKSVAAICIKKKQDPKSKYINGPISNSVKKKKLKSLFSRSL